MNTRITIALIFAGLHCTPRARPSVAVEYPKPPAQVGEDVDSKIEGELDLEVGKLVRVGERHLKGSLHELSKKIVTEYDGANEALVTPRNYKILLLRRRHAGKVGTSIEKGDLMLTAVANLPIEPPLINAHLWAS